MKYIKCISILCVVYGLYNAYMSKNKEHVIKYLVSTCRPQPDEQFLFFDYSSVIHTFQLPQGI